MPLPKISTPTYELEIPSLKKSIKYRPFLVKEEKVLIIAMESEDPKQIAEAVKTVIGNCIVTRGIKIEQLATFDIEYLFLNIRGKSVGETVDVLITCPDDGNTQVPVSINLDDIE
ncbi:MAG: baseplate protein, partial [bacterium]